jgi:hypothetical protein
MHRRPLSPEAPQASSSSAPQELAFSTDGINPGHDRASVHSNDENASPAIPGGILESDLEPTVRTRLMNHQNWDAASGCGSENCNHGAMSPRPLSSRSYGTITSALSRHGFGGPYPGDGPGSPGESADPTRALLGDTFADGVLGGNGQKSTTRYLAERHGVKSQRLM